MTLIETTVTEESVLDVIDVAVRDLQDAGLEPRFIVLGPVAYDALRLAIAKRFGRSPGTFEQYQYLGLVVDPAREDRLVVLPPPREVAEGLRIEQR